MYALSALAVIFLVLMGVPEASAENRVFIISNPAKGNGIDQCLANGEQCGIKTARSYCQSQEFAEVKTFRRVDPDEVTGSVPKPAADGCPNGGCNEYVAIICQR